MSDPYRRLGVPSTASDETIRAAYLAALRECPPERDPQRFEQVRAAYEAIAHERDRLAHALFDATAPTPEDVLAMLADDWQPGRASEHSLRRLLGGS